MWEHSGTHIGWLSKTRQSNLTGEHAAAVAAAMCYSPEIILEETADGVGIIGNISIADLAMAQAVGVSADKHSAFCQAPMHQMLSHTTAKLSSKVNCPIKVFVYANTAISPTA